MSEQQCVFCRIVEGEAPARLVYQDEDVTAFHDRNPQAPTHILIVPNRHLRDVNQVAPDDAALMGNLFVVARQVAEEQNLSGYRLVVNTGRSAGQSVFHLHMHLLSGRSFSWPPG
jgi:histidine triad (HIT) family protein